MIFPQQWSRRSSVVFLAAAATATMTPAAAAAAAVVLAGGGAAGCRCNVAARWWLWRCRVGLGLASTSTPFFYYYNYYFMHDTKENSLVHFEKNDDSDKGEGVSNNLPSSPKIVNDAADSSSDDSNDAIANDDDDLFDKDCPMCKKMLAGPCGDQFRAWYECSNQGEGDEYLERCKPLFGELLQCLEEYENSDSENDDD
jgi:hypothetical protein